MWPKARVGQWGGGQLSLFSDRRTCGHTAKLLTNTHIHTHTPFIRNLPQKRKEGSRGLERPSLPICVSLDTCHGLVRLGKSAGWQTW